MVTPPKNIFEGITPPPHQMGVILLGWFLFLVSLALPALKLTDMGECIGFYCLLFSFFFSMAMPHLAFTNLMMLASVIFLAFTTKTGRKYREVPYLLMAAFAATLTVLWDDTMGSPMIGYYLWSFSFLVTALGFFTMKPIEV